MISELSRLQEFKWNHGGRLESVTIWSETSTVNEKDVPNPGGGMIEVGEHSTKHYEYDALGQLIYSYVTSAGSTTKSFERHYIFERGRKVFFDNDGTEHIILPHPQADSDLAEERNNTNENTMWPLHDRLGTAVAAYAKDWSPNAGDEDAEVFKFDELGQPDTNNASLSFRLTHLNAGREFDSFTDLYQNRARWYDPSSGRFISTDPIGFAGGDTNLYRYVGNSFGNATDPTGNAANLVAGAIGAVAGGIIGGAGYLLFAEDASFSGFLASVGVGAAAGGLAGLTFGASLAATGTGFGGFVTASTAAGTVGGATAGGLNAGVQTGFTDAGAIGQGALYGGVTGAAGGLAFGLTAGGAAAFLPGGIASGAFAFGVGRVASDLAAQGTGYALGLQDGIDLRRTAFSGVTSAIGGGFLGRSDRSLLGLAQRGPALGRFVKTYNSRYGTRDVNNLRGSIFDDVVGDYLHASGLRNIQRQVTIRPTTARGGPAKKSFRSDYLADDPTVSAPRVVEAKSSSSATLTRNQKRYFPVFGRNGGVVRGANGGSAFPAGSRLPASNVQVIRPTNLPTSFRAQFGQQLNRGLTDFYFQYVVGRSHVPGLAGVASASSSL